MSAAHRNIKKIATFSAAVALTIGLMCSIGATVYNVFSPGGALGGTWNSQNVNLAAGSSFILNQLPVTAGGTNAASLTAHGVLLGEGTGSVSAVAAMAADTLLQGQGASADPASVSLLACGDATHALAYSTVSHAFSCQLVTGSATPGGVANSVQYNNAGAFGGVAVGADQLLQGSAGTPGAVSVPNCGSSTQALSYSTSTHTFGCQSLSGALTQNVSQSGTSTAAFTVITGVWTSSGGYITANNPANTLDADQWALKYTTSVPTAESITEAVINVTTWNVSSTNSRVGLGISGAFTGTAQNTEVVLAIQWASATTATALWLQPFTAGGAISAAFSFATGIDHTLKVSKNGYSLDAYVDGVLVLTTQSSTLVTAFQGTSNDSPLFMGLFDSGANVGFKNISQYSLTLP